MHNSIRHNNLNHSRKMVLLLARGVQYGFAVPVTHNPIMRGDRGVDAETKGVLTVKPNTPPLRLLPQ
jgi:hypothetical protein